MRGFTSKQMLSKLGSFQAHTLGERARTHVESWPLKEPRSKDSPCYNSSLCQTTQKSRLAWKKHHSNRVQFLQSAQLYHISSLQSQISVIALRSPLGARAVNNSISQEHSSLLKLKKYQQENDLTNRAQSKVCQTGHSHAVPSLIISSVLCYGSSQTNSGKLAKMEKFPSC